MLSNVDSNKSRLSKSSFFPLIENESSIIIAEIKASLSASQYVKRPPKTGRVIINIINIIIKVLNIIKRIWRNCSRLIESDSSAFKNLIELKSSVIIFRLLSKWIIKGIEISGINEKNMDERKFIYAPNMVSKIPTVIGIEILSLTLGISISSVRVVIKETNNDIIMGILNIYKIIKVVI